jgi:hypothetical protein
MYRFALANYRRGMVVPSVRPVGGALAEEIAVFAMPLFVFVVSALAWVSGCTPRRCRRPRPCGLLP